MKEQVLGLGISTYQAIQLDMNSELQMFKKCKDSSSCQKYLSVFPNGKFVVEIGAKMEEYDFNACVTTQSCSAFRKNIRTVNYLLVKSGKIVSIILVRLLKTIKGI